MYKPQKLLSLILCIIMISGLCSCNIFKDEDITVVTIWSSSTSSKIVYEKMVDNFNQSVGKANNILIDYQTKDSLVYKEELIKAFENGNPPDMFATFSRDFAEKEYIVPISEIEGGQEYINEFKDVPLRSENSLNGKIYCMPVSVTTHGLLYNKEMFVKAGLVDEKGNPTPPETFDELREYARILTNSKKDEYGIVLPLKWGGWYGSDIRSPMMSSCGYQDFNPVTGKYDYTGAVPIMKTFLGIKEDKSYVPGAESIDNDTARALFASGGVGMKFAFSFDVGVLNDQYPAGIDWGVAPLPVVDRNNKYKQRMAYGYSYCVTSQAVENIDNRKLIEILKYFTSAETLKELYINSSGIPFDLSVIEDVRDTELKTGWKEFCDIVSISEVYPEMPLYNINDSKKIENYFVEHVWTGRVTPEQCAAECAEAVNRAVAEYYQKLPDEAFNEFIIPDWDIKR